MDALLKWIRSHGVNAAYSVSGRGKVIVVELEWYNPDTGERGTEWEYVRNMSEAREKLGY